MYKYLVIVLLFTGCYNCKNLYQKREYQKDGYSLPYRILYPKNYDPTSKYPVITFLHGSGERGHDNKSQLKHGGSFFANELCNGNNSYIVIFPQCPDLMVWRDQVTPTDSIQPYGGIFVIHQTWPSRMVKMLLDSLQMSQIADPDKMYIGGMSIGGVGTFDLVERFPGYFAAAFPICGVGDSAQARFLAGKISFWLFHGDKDQIVPVQYSRNYFARLKEGNSDAKYTEYPGVRHNSWNCAFKEKELVPWMLSKRRNSNSQALK
jgi:predicted peptidase